MEFFSSIVTDLIVGGIVTAISFICGMIFNSRRQLKLRVKSALLWRKNIRVSISYLYSIRVDNRYLLIRGNNINQYQPVGGVYKTYQSFKDTQRKLEIKNELNENFYEKGDLRLKIKGKNLFSFVKWFESGKNREISVFREFYEELITTGILESRDIIDTKFEFIKRVNNGIKYSVHFSMEELLICDVYEVHTSKEIEKNC